MAKYFLHFEIFLLHLLILQVNSEPVFLDDTPKCTDIDTYLNAIENAFNFIKSADLNSDIAFGLMITRANMLHAALLTNLPDDLIERMLHVREAIENTVADYNLPLLREWTNNLGLVNVFDLNDVPPLEKPVEPVEVKFSSAKEYVEKIMDEEDNYVPLSEYCIKEFEGLSRKNRSLKCPIDEKCLLYVFYGPDYGCKVVHRLLLMILLNSRGCYVFKPAEEEKIKQKLCSTIYSQAQYIANYDYYHLETADLLMESVCLCSSLGYTQFLQRKWFSKILDLQADNGCFKSIPHLWRYKNNQHDFKNTPYFDIKNTRNCNPHLTIVSMAALTVAARFTMQKCYGTLIK